MPKKVRADYDSENDILWLHGGEKIKESAEAGSFVIDFSYDDKVIGIEILDASRVLSELILDEISREMLSKIKEANLRIHQSNDLSYIVIILSMTTSGKSKEISVQIPTPKSIAVK